MRKRMDDNASEDTMMDCGEDEKELDDLMELAANIANSSPSIKDAAERLLTLLGVDEDNDDFSSEDEGVEVDLDETDDEDTPQNSRLLQQLAVSLAQELKFAQRKNVISPSRTAQSHSDYVDHDLQKDIQRMEVGQDSSLPKHQNKKYSDFYRENSLTKCLETKESHSFSPYEFKSFGKSFCESTKRESLKKRCPYSRVRTDGPEARTKGKLLNLESNVTSWNAGWDSCASETLRYLVVDEGLPPHHPTVVAMKNHLDLQREQALLRSGCH